MGMMDAEEPRVPNRVRELRENKLMTQAQLARKAKVALRTIHSVEKGMNCRMDTKRKILLALGLKVSDKAQVFGSTLVDPRVDSTQQAAAELASGTARSLDASSDSSQEPSQANGGYES